MENQYPHNGFFSFLPYHALCPRYCPLSDWSNWDTHNCRRSNRYGTKAQYCTSREGHTLQGFKMEQSYHPAAYLKTAWLHHARLLSRRTAHRLRQILLLSYYCEDVSAHPPPTPSQEIRHLNCNLIFRLKNAMAWNSLKSPQIPM